MGSSSSTERRSSSVCWVALGRTEERPPSCRRMGLAGVIEFFGGTLILLGLFTRGAAFIASGDGVGLLPGPCAAGTHLDSSEPWRGTGDPGLPVPLFRASGGGRLQLGCDTGPRTWAGGSNRCPRYCGPWVVRPYSGGDPGFLGGPTGADGGLGAGHLAMIHRRTRHGFQPCALGHNCKSFGIARLGGSGWWAVELP